MGIMNELAPHIKYMPNIDISTPVIIQTHIMNVSAENEMDDEAAIKKYIQKR